MAVGCGAQCGMTNYRIDRIGTHRHASTPYVTTSTRQNRGRCIKVQFQGVSIGQAAGKESKQMDSCRLPTRQDKQSQRRHRAQNKASMPLKQA